MAASSEDKDFCHVLLRHFTEANQGVAPQMLIENVANFEREHTTIELDAIDSIAKCVAMKPEIFVLAIGENVPNLDTEESRNLFRDKVIALLKRIQEGSHPMIVVRSSFWPRECIDVPLKQACEAVGGVYVDIHELSVEENFARSERQIQHEGVAAHPGDRGMKAIADAIWKAIQEQKAAQKSGQSCR
jgi:alpha-galactosidase